MYFLLKIACIVIYLGAALSLVVDLPHGLALACQSITVLFLVAHVIEVMIFMPHLRLYKGPLSTSILLTLIFGLFHWKPLLDASKRDVKI
ncbi:hypothetical protein [Solimicrobium silvestre]|uniref:DUF1145 domain-containing protein n=1 Tax=Solimicrobium silvestre TaxID=2099400 RepID=A0A2S9GTV6_9BURK|nr:hypothetical protein [Solimicrobium silvestre]PRC91140.1 hypothetical protein S2091_4141 [Solimicrobium silvestre]